MANKSERWLDHTGLNLIRIVIGSYFMAISLGLIRGVDQSALFITLLPEEAARLVGTVLLFTLSVAFMSGLALRLSALMLALFVLCSSVIENYLYFETLTVSSFWRDLTLSCAVLLCYSSLKRREVRKAGVLMRRNVLRIRRGRQAVVRPRRVTMSDRPARRSDGPDYENVLRPLIAPTGPIQRPETLNGTQVVPARRPTGAPLMLPPPPADDEDVDNIFANI